MASSSSFLFSTATSTLLTVVLLLSTATETTSGAFSCTGTAKCHALVDYIPLNATNYAAIESLFGVKKLYNLLGANNLPITTHRNATVEPLSRVRVPIPCACANGTGISDGRPVYTVRPDDTLDGIARTIFGGLVTFQEIAAASNIPNPDRIDAGTLLTIPIPCSCDAVDGLEVVHYGHVVASGSSVAEIAATYGSTEPTLLRLNNMTNSSQLLAGQLLDVPLRACSSSMRNDSLETSLLVPNSTYVVTAYECITCRCDAANNWALQCEPSNLNSTRWNSCPSAQCSGNLTIGNTTTNSGSCTTCAYAGYNNQTILTTLIEQPTCRGANSASKMRMQGGWNWNFLFISFHLALLALAFS